MLGIISRAVSHVVTHMQRLESQGEASEAVLTFSFLEIYNEKVFDLLEPKAAELPVREDTKGNVVIQNLAELNIDR